MLRSDQNLDTIWDCTTIQPGDSGGAVYRGISGSSMVRAMGIISAYSPDSCYSLYAKLSGVKEWDSSISMPLN